jgi:hypothetical protein
MLKPWWMLFDVIVPDQRIQVKVSDGWARCPELSITGMNRRLSKRPRAI